MESGVPDDDVSHSGLTTIQLPPRTEQTPCLWLKLACQAATITYNFQRQKLSIRSGLLAWEPPQTTETG